MAFIRWQLLEPSPVGGGVDTEDPRHQHGSSLESVLPCIVAIIRHLTGYYVDMPADGVSLALTHWDYLVYMRSYR